jgi:branched-chain amino acid transport system substrate-binding protein
MDTKRATVRLQRGRRRPTALASVLAVAALGVAACGSSDSGSKESGAAGGACASQGTKEVTIGVPVPLSGIGKTYGEPYSTSLKLTADSINAAGGIKSMDGAKLKLDIQDDQSDPARAIQLLQKMAPDVSAFAGPLLSASLVGAVPTFARVKRAFVGVPLDDAVTNQKSEWVFRLTNRASTFGDQLFKFIDEQKMTSKIKKVGIIGINVPPGTSSTASVEKNAKKAGWDITKIDYDQKTTQDFGPIIAQLKDANVDLVTGFQNPVDSILFAKAISAQSWRPAHGFVWLAGGQTLATYGATLGASVDRWADITYAGPVGLQVESSDPLYKLANDFKTQTGTELSLLAGAAPSVVATIAAALEKGKCADPAKLRDSIREVNVAKGSSIPYYTLAGGVEFDAKGDNTAWQGQVYQLDSKNAKTKVPVVWPKDYAVTEMKWPADNG